MDSHSGEFPGHKYQDAVDPDATSSNHQARYPTPFDLQTALGDRAATLATPPPAAGFNLDDFLHLDDTPMLDDSATGLGLLFDDAISSEMQIDSTAVADIPAVSPTATGIHLDNLMHFNGTPTLDNSAVGPGHLIENTMASNTQTPLGFQPVSNAPTLSMSNSETFGVIGFFDSVVPDPLATVHRTDGAMPFDIQAQPSGDSVFEATNKDPVLICELSSNAGAIHIPESINVPTMLSFGEAGPSYGLEAPLPAFAETFDVSLPDSMLWDPSSLNGSSDQQLLESPGASILNPNSVGIDSLSQGVLQPFSDPSLLIQHEMLPRPPSAQHNTVPLATRSQFPANQASTLAVRPSLAIPTTLLDQASVVHSSTPMSLTHGASFHPCLPPSHGSSEPQLSTIATPHGPSKVSKVRRTSKQNKSIQSTPEKLLSALKKQSQKSGVPEESLAVMCLTPLPSISSRRTDAQKQNKKAVIKTGGSCILCLLDKKKCSGNRPCERCKAFWEKRANGSTSFRWSCDVRLKLVDSLPHDPRRKFPELGRLVAQLTSNPAWELLIDVSTLLRSMEDPWHWSLQRVFHNLKNPKFWPLEYWALCMLRNLVVFKEALLCLYPKFDAILTTAEMIFREVLPSWFMRMDNLSSLVQKRQDIIATTYLLGDIQFWRQCQGTPIGLVDWDRIEFTLQGRLEAFIARRWGGTETEVKVEDIHHGSDLMDIAIATSRHNQRLTLPWQPQIFSRTAQGSARAPGSPLCLDVSEDKQLEPCECFPICIARHIPAWILEILGFTEETFLRYWHRVHGLSTVNQSFHDRMINEVNGPPKLHIFSICMGLSFRGLLVHLQVESQGESLKAWIKSKQGSADQQNSRRVCLLLVIIALAFHTFDIWVEHWQRPGSVTIEGPFSGWDKAHLYYAWNRESLSKVVGDVWNRTFDGLFTIGSDLEVDIVLVLI